MLTAKSVGLVKGRRAAIIGTLPELNGWRIPRLDLRSSIKGPRLDFSGGGAEGCSGKGHKDSSKSSLHVPCGLYTEQLWVAERC